MKFLSLLTLLCSNSVLASSSDLLLRDNKCPPQKDGNTDDQIIAAYKSTGQCFSYINGGNRDKSIAPCAGPDGYCQKVKNSTSDITGCKLFIAEGTTIDPNLYNYDADCNAWYPGECLCECEFCDEIVEFVIEGLAQLDNIICLVMLSAFQEILDVGLTFVPGGQASSAVKAAVQGAKSFYENGEEAASFFGGWIGPACGIDDFHFDPASVFDPLVNAPDSMSRGPPVGCKRKSGCRQLDPVPDPPTKPDQDKPTDEPKTTADQKTTEQPKTSIDPVTTTTEQPAKTTESQTITTTTTSSETSTSTPGAGCAYCGEFDKKNVARNEKYGEMYARAGTADSSPACVLPPAEDISTKRGFTDLVFDKFLPRSTWFAERALTEKESKFTATLGKLNYQWTFSVGKYAPSGDAASIPEITKYWRFKDPGNEQECSVELEQVAASQISIGDYDTDHVFEAQTLTRFFVWLTDEDPNGVGTTYKKPSTKWVTQNVLGDGSFKIIKPGNTNPGDLFTPSEGETLS
ncbi:hypothetical protein F5Y08DRAFT_327864 [Xylaria arbuscula]|nr:hypothetical protein F5Y08DRAFT_327864 [Xylaria arbuscula]